MPFEPCTPPQLDQLAACKPCFWMEEESCDKAVESGHKSKLALVLIFNQLLIDVHDRYICCDRGLTRRNREGKGIPEPSDVSWNEGRQFLCQSKHEHQGTSPQRLLFLFAAVRAAASGCFWVRRLLSWHLRRRLFSSFLFLSKLSMPSRQNHDTKLCAWVPLSMADIACHRSAQVT